MNGVVQSNSVDRWITLSAVGALGALSWIYLFAVPMPMPIAVNRLTWPCATVTFLMWFVMMIAMMTPAVLPVVLLFQRVVQRLSSPKVRTLLFSSGYFSAWCVFSIAATVLQLLLMRIGWIDDMGVAKHKATSAIFMMIVGVYQWLPVKGLCLTHCRSPAESITRYFRPSVPGAWSMGFRHGLYCLGCCWLLMLLLFVGGVMNLVWVAAITLIVVIEKMSPYGRMVQRILGAALIAVAIAVLV